MKSNVLDINRLLLLFKRQFSLYSSTIYIAYGAVSGILMFIFYLIAYFQKTCDYNSQVHLFFTVFFIAGYIFSSRSFNELGDYRTGYMYLTLPVSNLERLLVGWLNSSLVYAVIGVITFFVISTVANMLAAVSSGFTFEWFGLDFYSKIVLPTLIYLVTQTVFVMGAAFFKKNPFLKTLLAIFIISVALNIITTFLGFAIIGEFNPHNMNINDNNFPIEFKMFIEDTFPVFFKILFWYITVPFFLLVSYFRLKETEI